MIQNYEEFLNVKGVTEADRKFVDTYIAPNGEAGIDHATNPFTLARFDTNVLIANLCLFIQDLSRAEFAPYALNHWDIPEGRKIQCFDRARYLVLKLDRRIYAEVID